MANLLKQLELEELSLVDRPANAQATVSLFKRDNSEGDTMSEELTKMTDGQKEEMDKMSDDMKSKMKMYMDKGMSYDKAKAMANEDMKKADDPSEEIQTLKAENERLRKGLLEEGYVIKADTIEKKAEEEFIEYGGEQINKADVPAPILKALEEAEIEKADAALTKRAEAELPHFSVDVAKKLMTAVERWTKWTCSWKPCKLLIRLLQTRWKSLVSRMLMASSLLQMTRWNLSSRLTWKPTTSKNRTTLKPIVLLLRQTKAVKSLKPFVKETNYGCVPIA